MRSIPRNIGEINRLAAHDPAALIAESEQKYHAQVEAFAERILGANENHEIIMLSGPSGSGKTTTAHKIRKALEARGIGSLVISLDNFYLGGGKAPVLPDGSYDYESVYALNIPLMTKCLRELVETGESNLPVFNFQKSAPAEELEHVEIGPGEVVIVEGIHAMNPIITGQLPQDKLVKLYVSVRTKLMAGDKKAISRRAVRLVRRMIRDDIFRSSSPQNTLSMWTKVLRGEELYLFPNEDNADVYIDTLHDYEPGILKGRILPLLDTIPKDVPNYDMIERLYGYLGNFEPIPMELLPPDSMLHEFVG